MEQTSETNSEIAEILGLSHQKFKSTAINMLRTLMEKSGQHAKNRWVV